MKKIEKKDLWMLMMQLVVWGLILLLPPLTALFSTGDWHSTWVTARTAFIQLRSPIVLYFINFYLLIPYLFFRQRRWEFFLSNAALFVGINYWLFYTHYLTAQMSDDTIIGFYSGLFLYFLLNCAVIAVAVAIRQYLKTSGLRQMLQEEKQKSVEAELAWLKNQINPHFLFNTLNNISSLTQIDPDSAQDAIAQLSDLLRYAMYETNKTMAPILGEVEFMQNYIALMKLRCSDKTEVRAQFSVPDTRQEIAPLLFVSLIENAFKHGLSSSRPSSVNIRLEQSAEGLTFSCDNTNYPKDDADRSGSGIGLENTRRRLELLYPGRYQWEQSLQGDIYHVAIRLTTTKPKQ